MKNLPDNKAKIDQIRTFDPCESPQLAELQNNLSLNFSLCESIPPTPPSHFLVGNLVYAGFISLLIEWTFNPRAMGSHDWI